MFDRSRDGDNSVPRHRGVATLGAPLNDILDKVPDDSSTGPLSVSDFTLKQQRRGVE